MKFAMSCARARCKTCSVDTFGLSLAGQTPLHWLTEGYNRLPGLQNQVLNPIVGVVVLLCQAVTIIKGSPIGRRHFSSKVERAKGFAWPRDGP